MAPLVSFIVGHNKMIKIIIGILIASSIFFGCQTKTPYSGDGKLIDHGTVDSNHRYVLDLGLVNLGQEQQYIYSIRNLPEKTFVFGLEIKLYPPNKQFFDQKPIDCILKFTIEDENGVIKISENGNIRDWVWSGPVTGESVFIYRRGVPGTYFTPEIQKAYKIKLDITKASKGTTYPIKLIGTTAGWK